MPSCGRPAVILLLQIDPRVILDSFNLRERETFSLTTDLLRVNESKKKSLSGLPATIKLQASTRNWVIIQAV